jgi:hypothetical protein
MLAGEKTLFPPPALIACRRSNPKASRSPAAPAAAPGSADARGSWAWARVIPASGEAAGPDGEAAGPDVEAAGLDADGQDEREQESESPVHVSLPSTKDHSLVHCC